MRTSWRLAMALLAQIAIPLLPAHADGIAVGVNVVELEKPGEPRAAQEDITLGDLKAAGVRVIRTGIANTDAGLDYIRRTYAQGIKLDWVVSLQFPPGAPKRPWMPKEFPMMWSAHPLSSADPELFRTYFQTLLGKLEAMHIELAAFELGNEFNMAAFNGEFPLPGQGKQFGLNDLNHDPEGQQIAKGYLQYLKVLAVLKDVRDHSNLNRRTPILTAGFGAMETPEGPSTPAAPAGKGADMVSVNATLSFMRAHGLDKLVDAYAVHVYPWANGPGQPAAATGRRDRLARYVLTQCQRAGSRDGKPCWITEWGFKNKDASCPAREADQISLLREMRDNFRPYVQQGRLTGLFYYAWVDTRENFGIFRCGKPTETGRLAIAPM
jgi:hypothetical protein